MVLVSDLCGVCSLHKTESQESFNGSFHFKVRVFVLGHVFRIVHYQILFDMTTIAISMHKSWVNGVTWYIVAIFISTNRFLSCWHDCMRSFFCVSSIELCATLNDD